jgi:hypothetical protein
MASTYTLNNGIELIGTGEQSGTWGDTTNTNLSLVDTALDGQVTVTLPSAGTSGSPNTLAISDGAASDGRNRMVIFNDGGDLGATAYVQLTPNDAEKIIYVRNDLAGSRSIILFQGTYNASNDYELPAGTTAVIYFDGAGSGAVAANVFNNAYFDSLRLGSVSVTAILDEDDMSSDSATALATQQSIKAYVDTQITAEDLDFAGDSGTGAVDLDSQTFTVAGTTNEIETSASGQTLTIGLPDNVTIAGDLTVDTDTLYVDSTNNRVGVNVSSPVSPLQVTSGANGNIIHANGASNAWDFILKGTNDGDTESVLYELGMYRADGTTNPNTVLNFGRGLGEQNGFFTIDQNGSEVMRIDSSQRVLIGLTSAIEVGSTSSAGFEVASTGTDSWISQTRFNDSNSGPLHLFGKSRSATVGTFGTVVEDGDALGTLSWAGDDGTDAASVAAQIQGAVDGTPGSNDMPGRLVFSTTADGAAAPTQRMWITSDGYVGIATSSPSSQLEVSSSGDTSLTINAANNNDSKLIFSEAGNAEYSIIMDGLSGSTQSLQFYNNRTSTEVMRIDSSARLLIGGTTARNVGGSTSALQIEGASGVASSASIVRNTDNASAAFLSFAKSRGSSVGSDVIVQDEDGVGEFRFSASDGTDTVSQLASIEARIDGTPGANDMPGRLVFSTTADGGNSATERMRITNGGLVGVGETDPDVRLHSSINTATEYDDTYNLSNSNNLPIYALRLQNNDTSITNSEVNLLFSAGASGSCQHSIGVKRTGTNDGDLIFRRRTNTTSTESMRLTNGGELLLNRTDTGVSVTTSGIELNDSGYISASRSLSNDSGAVGYFNRLDSTAGDLIQLRIDGVERGVIGITGTDNMYMASSDGLGLKFNADASRFDMCNASGTSLDAAADIGGDSSRIKDIKLSGGIYLGGVAAANKLDDYETGTFDPVMTGVSGWSSDPQGWYTKIGNMVYFRILFTSNTGASGTPSYIITGMPFANELGERNSVVSISRMFGIDLANSNYIGGVATSQIQFSYVNGDNNNNSFSYSGSTLRLTISGSYQTAS